MIIAALEIQSCARSPLVGALLIDKEEFQTYREQGPLDCVIFCRLTPLFSARDKQSE